MLHQHSTGLKQCSLYMSVWIDVNTTLVDSGITIYLKYCTYSKALCHWWNANTCKVTCKYLLLCVYKVTFTLIPLWTFCSMLNMIMSSHYSRTFSPLNMSVLTWLQNLQSPEHVCPYSDVWVLVTMLPQVFSSCFLVGISLRLLVMFTACWVFHTFPALKTVFRTAAFICKISVAALTWTEWKRSHQRNSARFWFCFNWFFE